MGVHKNPLYVVTNSGKDIEQASGLADLIIKKLGLGPVIDTLENILAWLWDQVKDYPTFVMVKGVIDSIVDSIQSLMSLVKA
jgi:phage-related protein